VEQIGKSLIVTYEPQNTHTDTDMAENESDPIVEGTQVEKVDIDPSKLTPTSPEVISKYDAFRSR
jgi:hypothetical protein